MGVVPAPAVTVRRPWRVPGWDGSEGDDDGAGGVAGEGGGAVGGVGEVAGEGGARVKGRLPVLPMVTVWVQLEVVVTTDGVGEVDGGGGDGEVGVGGGAVDCRAAGGIWPVTRTVRPWSRVRVVESAGGGLGGDVVELELADGVGGRAGWGSGL